MRKEAAATKQVKKMLQPVADMDGFIVADVEFTINAYERERGN
jgi:hypothetical protein